jgi:hypothetical protein
MAFLDDFTIAANGDIRHDSGTSTYTVLEMHRALQDLADDAAASGDDLVDITSPTPSERSTDNIITLINGYNIDDTAAEYLYDGSITQDGGDVVYSGLVVVGSLASTTTLKIVQNKVFYDDQDAPFWGTDLNADAGANILMRCLVKTRTGGADIDGKRIRVQARTYGDTYAEFSVTLGLGNSTAAIFTNSDLNNDILAATVDAWTEVTNTEGYQLIDIDNDSTDEDYYSQWAISATPSGGDGNINDLYQWAKALTRANHAGTPTIHGMDAELFRGITHSVAYTTASGNFTEDEELTWGTGATAGSGILLADDDNGTSGTFYIQLTSGVAPNANTITGGTSTETATASTVTARTLTPCFVGTSTGSNLIAAYGIGVDTTDASVGDQYFPLDGTGPILPPNQQTFTVSALVSGEDRVLVGPKDTGNDIEFDQFTTSGSHTNASTTVTVGASIPSDTPATGTIRIQDNNGVYQRMTYTGRAGTTFTGCTGSGSWTADSGNNLFISYIDKLADAASASYVAVYSSDRALWIRVRDGGASPIKTFETGGTFGSGGGSVAAIRTSDA